MELLHRDSRYTNTQKKTAIYAQVIYKDTEKQIHEGCYFTNTAVRGGQVCEEDLSHALSVRLMCLWGLVEISVWSVDICCACVYVSVGVYTGG